MMLRIAATSWRAALPRMSPKFGDVTARNSVKTSIRTVISIIDADADEKTLSKKLKEFGMDIEKIAGNKTPGEKVVSKHEF